jgi:hypothetical protein
MSVEDVPALSHRLRAMTNEALLASAKAGTPPAGLGATSTFSLGFDELFLKRLPLTDIEAVAATNIEDTPGSRLGEPPRHMGMH